MDETVTRLIESRGEQNGDFATGSPNSSLCVVWPLTEEGSSPAKLTMLNEYYKEILQSLLDEKVKFLLAGACAMAVHGYPRGAAALRALQKFGAPLHGLTAADLQQEGTVFQIGVAQPGTNIVTEMNPGERGR